MTDTEHNGSYERRRRRCQTDLSYIGPEESVIKELNFSFATLGSSKSAEPILMFKFKMAQNSKNLRLNGH